MYNVETQDHNVDNLLLDLDWLPVLSRITFKVASLCYTALRLERLSYLHETLHMYAPSQALCTFGQNLLASLRSRTNSAALQFSSSGSALWNTLQSGVHDCDSVVMFKLHIKAYLFHQNFGSD